MSTDLNSRLPQRCFAEANAQFGIEIDVVTWQEPGGKGNAAGIAGTWTPPAPAQTLAFPLTGDVVEVLIYDTQAGPTLIGAIELVSPSNKDRPESRDAFVAKCATLLRAAVGLVIVDVVGSLSANLHDELVRSLHGVESHAGQLYASAYRPVDVQGQSQLEIWYESLAVGMPLPTVPLWLHGVGCLALDLSATNDRTCRDLRIDSAAFPRLTGEA